MLKWIPLSGKVSRVEIECSKIYALGLLRYIQSSDIKVLEVITPDKVDRRKRSNDDTIDAENAAYCNYVR
ncbi:TPA: hypothetical protein ACX6SN_001196 [Photobacterium damselae]